MVWWKKASITWLAALVAGCAPASNGKGAVDLVASDITDRSVTLTWKDSANGETSFSVERSEISETTGYNQVGTVAAGGTTFHDVSVQPSKTYFYRVVSLFAEGAKINSSAVRVTTDIAAVIPFAPTGLTAKATSMNEIDLTWVDNSANETGFEIERGAAQGGPFTAIKTTAANAVAYTDTGLTKSTQYFYRVRSTNTAGGSPYSLVASDTTYVTNDKVPPSIPLDVVATPASTTSITVSWTASTDAESGVGSYAILRNMVEIGSVNAPGTSFTATLLGSGAMYCYQVVAVDVVGNRSGPSTPPACATTPTVPSGPNPPTNADAGPVGQTTITVTWVDNSTDESGFRVERGTAAAGPFTQLLKPDGGAPATAANVTSYQAVGLTAATTYFFRVLAVSDGGLSTPAVCTARTTP